MIYWGLILQGYKSIIGREIIYRWSGIDMWYFKDHLK